MISAFSWHDHSDNVKRLSRIGQVFSHREFDRGLACPYNDRL